MLDASTQRLFVDLQDIDHSSTPDDLYGACDYSAVYSHEIGERIPSRPAIGADAVVFVRYVGHRTMDGSALSIAVPCPATESEAIIWRVIGFGSSTSRTGKVADVGSLCRHTTCLTASS